MCGIAGFVGAGDAGDLQRMTDALAHRGPDGEGSYSDPETALWLGHRRLAVVDLEGGAQPMASREGDLQVTYNGEIYNHRELRADLESRGHRFQTSHSDTEVLIHGYREWGPELPLRLNGMFAFALYDKTRRRLFLARDRFGEKPLYYHRGPGHAGKGAFVFASELHALARHPAVVRDLDLLALQKYFAHGYFPGATCIYGSCRRLPAGHHLSYDLATGARDLTAYWRFSLAPDEALAARGDGALAEEFRGLLQDATQRRMLADVPLGIFLSGGLDSSSILAMACRAGTTRPKTFTIGFKEESFDESPHARAVAGALGSDHHEKTLDLDGAAGLVPRVLSRLDEPLADASILPTHLLCAHTREKVTVALSGDGGDELLAGYDPFKALAPARLYAMFVSGGLHRRIRRLADLLPVSTRNMSLGFKISRALKGLSCAPSTWNPVWMSPVEPSDLRDIFEAPLDPGQLYEEAITQWESSSGDLIDRTLEFFTSIYLPDDILVKSDRASMMVSLETRAAFLDNDLVDFCRRLPNRFKIRGGTRKFILKEAMTGLLSDDIIRRPKKGFGIPLTDWLRGSTLTGDAVAIAGIDQAPFARLLEEHKAGKADHRLALWAWLSLQEWHKAQVMD